MITSWSQMKYIKLVPSTASLFILKGKHECVQSQVETRPQSCACLEVQSQSQVNEESRGDRSNEKG